MNLHIIKTQSSELQRCAEEVINNEQRLEDWKLRMARNAQAPVLQLAYSGGNTRQVATNSNVIKMPHHKRQYTAPLNTPPGAAA